MKPKSLSARCTLRCIALLVFCLSGLGCYSSNRESPTGPPEPTAAKTSTHDPPSPSRASLTGLNSSFGLRTHSSKTSTRTPQPQFRDVSRQVGIRFQAFNDEVPHRYFLPEVMGTGVAWIDFDLDGWLDLFLANGCLLDGTPDTGHQCQLYRNSFGQSFLDVTAESRAGCVLYGQGCAVGDFNSDGFPDLFIGGYGADRLMRNNGDGTFDDVTAQSGVSDPRWSSSSFWMDFDGDELLDLFVVNYVEVSLENHRVCTYGKVHGYCGPGTYESQPDCAYRNLGDGRFEEMANSWGLNADNGKGLAAIAVDIDLDLKPEVYVANDMTANFLFARDAAAADSPLVFREIAAPSGCAVSGAGMNEASMGIGVADFNCDGLPDLFLTHYYHAKNTLYQNLGNRLFEDSSYYSKAAATSTESLGFGIVVMDYNRDGSPDLFIATGHVLGSEMQPQKMTCQLLHNDRGIFTDVSASAGDYFQKPGIARCAAAADYDNDGDLDIAVSQVGSPFTLLRNDTIVPEHPYVGLTLATSNRIPPIGGRVICRVNGRSMDFPIVAGGSYLAAADDRLLLAGWEDAEGEIAIEIHWPSGRIDRFDHLARNQYSLVREGAGLQSP